MLYLLGGASRAGKSTLAQRLLCRRCVPYFPLDVLMMGVAGGWPEAGVDPDTSSEVRAARLWPVVRAMAVNLLEEERTHPSYLLEGDLLLPCDVAALHSDYPGRVRGCFVGYTHAEPSEVLRRVRSVEPDWYAWAPDVEALAFLAEQVEFSRQLERDCASLGLPYFDVSTSSTFALDKVYGYLVEGEPGPALGGADHPSPED